MVMNASRNIVGGLGNLMFIKAYLIAQVMEGKLGDTYVQQFSKWAAWAPEVKATFLDGVSPGSVQKCSLHIRRGDYLKAGIYVNLAETDYYKKAIDYVDSYWTSHALSGYDGQSFANSPTYLVFCKDNQGWEQDKADRQWCREYLDKFIPGRYELVNPRNREEEDMNLMASCVAHIGANSSFSWFACFLGGGLSVMPQAWFVPGAPALPVEMLPEWKLL